MAKLIVNNTMKNNEKIFEGAYRDIFFDVIKEMDYEKFEEDKNQPMITIEFVGEKEVAGWLETHNSEEDYKYLLENYISDSNYYYQHLE
ncbi:TPA: hypothetical protein LA460_000278 [Clostridium botulinum]|nr:hypothetical protein [Clostridium botulinum]HBJ1652882.1 hypothetical protein [Clostridium botulinum]